MLGDERLVDEDEEEGAECDDDDDDTDDDEDDEEQEMRVFGECGELEDYDDEFDQAGNHNLSCHMISYNTINLIFIYPVPHTLLPFFLIVENEYAEGNAEEKADMRLYRYTEGGGDQTAAGEKLRSGEERERMRERGRERERGSTGHRSVEDEEESHERGRREPKQRAAEDGDGDDDGEEKELSAVRRRSF